MFVPIAVILALEGMECLVYSYQAVGGIYCPHLYGKSVRNLGKNDDADMTKRQNKGSERQPMANGSHRGLLVMCKHKKGWMSK
jgi:hypothetical protein